MLQFWKSNIKIECRNKLSSSLLAMMQLFLLTAECICTWPGKTGLADWRSWQLQSHETNPEIAADNTMATSKPAT